MPVFLFIACERQGRPAVTNAANPRLSSEKLSCGAIFF
jgi:hypothetical protein